MTDAAGTEFGWGIELRSTSYGVCIETSLILILTPYHFPDLHPQYLIVLADRFVVREEVF